MTSLDVTSYRYLFKKWVYGIIHMLMWIATLQKESVDLAIHVKMRVNKWQLSFLTTGVVEWEQEFWLMLSNGADFDSFWFSFTIILLSLLEEWIFPQWFAYYSQLVTHVSEVTHSVDQGDHVSLGTFKSLRELTLSTNTATNTYNKDLYGRSYWQLFFSLVKSLF